MRLFALAFVLGTLLLQNQAELPEVRWALLGAAAALAWTRVPRKRTVFRCALLCSAGALVGFGYAAWRAEARLSDALPRALEGSDVILTGVVASLPKVNEQGERFTLAVERAECGALPSPCVPRTVALSWYAERARGESQAAIAPPPVAPGERWRFAARLKRPRGLANPHTFDFEAWALERDIRATGYVRASDSAVRLSEQVDGWPYTLHRWRSAIRDRILRRLGDEARLRGVLVALAIGDQESIAPGDWDVFWRTGVGHLMSISGLHITMLAGLGFALAYFAWVRVPALALRIPARKAAAVAGALTALGYTLMTGYEVPAQRTFLMLATVAACALADRHESSSRVLALAALAVLVLDPWAVVAPGFWLSFGAVASIFYVMALRTGRQGKLRGMWLEQVAVTVVMLPMLLALFQQVSLVSPIANAFAIPLVSLGVVPLTVAGAFLPLPFLLDLAHGLMAAIMVPLQALAALPVAMLENAEPAAWTVAAAVSGCLWLLAPRGIPLRCVGLLWIAPMFLLAPAGPAPGEAWIDVLDVGNGLAIVVRTAHHALAYDTGPTWNEDSDTGGRIVVPYLRGEGVRNLDGLVISHADDDHAGGATSVTLERSPGWLLSSLPPEHPLHAMFEANPRCEAGQHWRWDGVDFQVLHPAAAIYAEGAAAEKRKRKENDRGCVIRIATSRASALFAADVEARSEAEMLARDPGALRSDVLVIGHHGSKTSSTPAFIAAVDPAFGLLSVGYRNRFHHPNPAVVARYLARGVELHRTDQEGALNVRLPVEATGRVAVQARGRGMRYWSEHRQPPPKENNMGLMDILNQYASGRSQPATQAPAHFEEAAQGVPVDVLSRGIAGAFRSDQTPPFAQMVAQLFGKSDPHQRAGVLNQLLGSLGPAAAAALESGGVGSFLNRLGGAVSPEQASSLTPDQVRELADHAEQHNPSVVDRVSHFYAQHPTLVASLGSAALAVVLTHMAQHNRS
jgi:competence protein ComEC